MDEQFNLEFTCFRERITATCEKFRGPKYIQYRVHILHRDNTDESFEFFEVNQPGQKFAWFTYSERRNRISAVIARALTEKSKPVKPRKAEKFRTFLVYTILFIRALSRIPGQVREYALNLKHGYEQVLAEVAKAEKRVI